MMIPRWTIDDQEPADMDRGLQAIVFWLALLFLLWLLSLGPVQYFVDNLNFLFPGGEYVELSDRFRKFAINYFWFPLLSLPMFAVIRCLWLLRHSKGFDLLVQDNSYQKTKDIALTVFFIGSAPIVWVMYISGTVDRLPVVADSNPENLVFSLVVLSIVLFAISGALAWFLGKFSLYAKEVGEIEVNGALLREIARSSLNWGLRNIRGIGQKIAGKSRKSEEELASLATSRSSIHDFDALWKIFIVFGFLLFLLGYLAWYNALLFALPLVLSMVMRVRRNKHIRQWHKERSRMRKMAKGDKRYWGRHAEDID